MLFARVSYNCNHTYLPINKIYAYEITDYGYISIVDLPELGKTLLLDNELQTCDLDHADYTNNLVFPHKPGPDDRSLILGAGEGETTDLLLKYGYRHVTSVDIDPEALELYRIHLADWNNGIYDRQDEFTLIFQDALEYLKEQPDKSLDYIIYDLDSQAARELSENCFKEIYRVLKDGGVCSCQDGSSASESISKPAESLFKKDPVVRVSLDWRFKHWLK